MKSAHPVPIAKAVCGLLAVLTTWALFGDSAKVLAADPELNSWFVINSGKPAQIYRTTYDKEHDQTVTTWSNGRLAQCQPVLCGVQQILSSPDWIYIRSTGLGSQVMGPWYIDPQGRIPFPNLPTDQHYLFRLPRHPVVQAASGWNHLGEIGMFVDGVRMFDSGDAFSYSTANGRDADPRAGIGQGDRVWNRDAYVNERVTFDAALGHQQMTGRYHYHAEPIALRYQLGDHVDYDAVTKTYRESSAPATKHSPILGWLQDGYPLYGPYGYADPANPHNGVRRVVSGYVLRDGRWGADNLAVTGRTNLPLWAARERNCAPQLGPAFQGPAVSARYPLGHYIEDYAYRGDLGQIQGRDFDLDELNGRWCVTPEFPQGTYAYFTTIDAQGAPVYPYNMGRKYHGIPRGGLVNAISEPVVTNFVASVSANTLSVPPGTVTLNWEDGHGGGYQAK